MRKSKSRADDEISSTNGSLLNEENTEADETGVQGGEAESPDNFKDPPKKRKSKSKSKKKTDEGDNGDFEDKDTIDDGVSSTNGSLANDGQDADVTQDDNHDIDQDDENSVKNKKKKSSKTKAKNKKSGKVSKKKEVEEYEVEKIMGSKKIKGKLHYLIRWKGYGSDDDTWEPEKTVSCPDLISRYVEEKGNSKGKDKQASKKSKSQKRKAQPEKAASKRPKTVWDEENADTNAEYEVDRILEVHIKKNGKREFLIHWKGWSSKFDSWEPEDNLNCLDLIKKFMSKVEAARSVDNRSLRPAPESTARFTLQDPSSGRRLSKRRGQRQRVRYDNAE